MFTDFVLNGVGHGPVGEVLNQSRFDAGMLQPYIDAKGRRCVTINTGRMLKDDKGRPSPEKRNVPINLLRERGMDSAVWNAATLRKEDWIMLDSQVQRATRQRLKAWNDLASSSTRGGFNGMAKMTLEYQAMTDPGEALQDMDGLTDGRRDRPLFNLKSVPLPITHSDFWFSQREVEVSRNSNTPLDTTMAEAAGRRVAELIEKQTIGVETGITYGTVTAGPGTHTGTSTIYGYTNFPYRVTKTDLTTPTGTNPEAIVQDVMEMIETMNGNGFFGPFMLYTSTPYSIYLNSDYFRAGSTSAVRTVRERLMEVEGITDIRRLDYLTSGYQLILIQMDSTVAQAVVGMDVTTLQWESQGGMRRNFKVMCIKLPLLRSPYNGVAGIVHGTTS